jgi:hypothetical protein
MQSSITLKNLKNKLYHGKETVYIHIPDFYFTI